MSAPWPHAAVDLGASSVRMFRGRLERDRGVGDRLVVEEVLRVATGPVMLPDGLHSDVVHAHQAMLGALAALSHQAQGGLTSVGIDGWGVDYGLLDAGGRLLGLPYHYRDARTKGMRERAEHLLGPGRLYDATGAQEIELNTVFQLMADKATPAYAAASQLLMLPDLLGYFLTGERRFERTNASTTQLVDTRTGLLAEEVLVGLGLRRELFAAAISPGEILGPVRPDIAAAAGIASRLSVVAVASHDTASAVLAVPTSVDDFAYVVSGTWSLVGLELERPVIDDQSKRANFANELGVDGTVRFLRNAMGHWMLQECERSWAAEGRPVDLPRLLGLAAAKPAFASLVDTDDPGFSEPGAMPERVRRACAARGEVVPADKASLVRCIVDSMALAIARTLEDAQRCTGRDVRVLHVVGGGAANDLLLALVAAATGLPVVAGPVEASAVGNLLVQLRAAGRVGDREEMRRVVARSFLLKAVTPDPELSRKARAARTRLAEHSGGAWGGLGGRRASGPLGHWGVSAKAGGC